MGRIIPYNEMENKRCLKPSTSVPLPDHKTWPILEHRSRSYPYTNAPNYVSPVEQCSKSPYHSIEFWLVKNGISLSWMIRIPNFF
jgi:hypothetical protein